MQIRIKRGLYNFLWNKGEGVEFMKWTVTQLKMKYSDSAEDILPFLVF